MKAELDKTYNSLDYEDKIYKKWEESGFFNPDNLDLAKNAPSYTILLPPPNITDKLHIGHSVVFAIEDLLVRYHRLLGERTLWLPGTDHAAIATQHVVEKRIFKSSGQTRNDLGKDKFLAEVWDFVKVTQATILEQSRKMGASLDWSRLAFTLDDERQHAVRTMFKDMYEAGVIYRGERIVNWCPRCHSTLSDDEVEHSEQSAKLYTFKYNKDFPISISTTRPETKLGDTAVAVNPSDDRYKKYIGQEFKVNFVGQDLNLRIISDRNVEVDFGTGALGVTPAHSLVDWQMAEANGLPIIKVINEDGLITAAYGEYSGKNVLEAREMIVARLNALGLMEKEEEITNNLSVCYRCGTAIEPLPSKQWFVAVDKPLERLGNKSLKEAAKEVALKGTVKFLPERFSKRYLDWMDNLHDWCISRQIWFGHQIPVWYQGDKIFAGLEAPIDGDWNQDPDTLDTWFSSGMWSFSTLGWPNNYIDGKKKINDLATFHPTQVLETGYEILTLWVSRMIMMSLFALNEVPFEKVYLHGMILDKDGKKMSKSKGNGIDPVDMIAKFGTDALRLSLLMGATPGNDARFSEEKVESKRNFVNKLWNISRYILDSVDDKYYLEAASAKPKAKTLADDWILGNLEVTINKTTKHLNEFNFSLATEELNDFTYNKLADWYLEIAKVEKNKEEILIHILKNLLILWHPFIPFVTEVIWGNFNESILMVATWPSETKSRKNWVKIETDMQEVQNFIVSVRKARSENKIEPAKKIKALVYSPANRILSEQAELLKNLKTGLVEINFIETEYKDMNAIKVLSGQSEIYLLDAVDAEKEAIRIKKESANLEKLINNLTLKLANPEFVANAPKNIIETERTKLASYTAELKKLSK